VTKDGNVTLRGNVDSDAERDAVLAKAKEVAGSANITNDLTVKAPKTKKTTGE
jgi:osmotically-inducible protein OsmY